MDRKARFVIDEPRPVPERPDADPMTLLSGRAGVAQWHTETRTAKSAVLRKLSASQPYVEIHSDDAAQEGSDSLGWELDATLQRAFGPYITARTKFAYFDGRTEALPDRWRAWFEVTFAF